MVVGGAAPIPRRSPTATSMRRPSSPTSRRQLHRPERGLRPRALGVPVRRRGGSDRARQRHALRPRRRRLDARHPPRPPGRARSSGRHGVDQHVPRHGLQLAVRRLQGRAASAARTAARRSTSISRRRASGANCPTRSRTPSSCGCEHRGAGRRGREAGLQTTIQDGGRPGHLSRGIPPAGAQDFYSLAIANLLVGNELTPPPLSPRRPGAAGLEMLVKGVTLRFAEEAVIALAGADMGATLDGEPVRALDRDRASRPGGSSSVGKVRPGRARLPGHRRRHRRAAVARAAPPTCAARRAASKGRALRKGDRLRIAPAPEDAPRLAGRAVPPDLPPAPDERP